MRSLIFFSIFLLLPVSTFAAPHQRRGMAVTDPEALASAADRKVVSSPGTSEIKAADVEAPPVKVDENPRLPQELVDPPPEVVQVEPTLVERIKEASKRAWKKGKTKASEVIQGWLDKLSDAATKRWVKKHEALNIKAQVFEVNQKIKLGDLENSLDDQVKKYIEDEGLKDYPLRAAEASENLRVRLDYFKHLLIDAQQTEKTKFEKKQRERETKIDSDHERAQRWIKAASRMIGSPPKVPSAPEP